MNTRNIQPKTIWTSAGEKLATVLCLNNFTNYHFDNGSGLVNYKLIGFESPGTTTDENGNTISLPETAIDYFFGQVEIPAEIIQQWGASDEIIFTYVSNQLGLTIITN